MRIRSPSRFLRLPRQGDPPVDRYWSRHTVRSQVFVSAEESLDYLEHRFDLYPLFRELMGLWGDHSGETVLDYGCGPGNDLVGFTVYARPAHVIGVDVSQKALRLAAKRLEQHGIGSDRVELIQASDATAALPIADGRINYVHCAGVLHHTSDPVAIMRELRRVLAEDGRGSVMVYNRDSVWYHLYTAYIRMIAQAAFSGMTLDEAFARNTDGPQCPIARCYRPEEFSALAREAGFSATYRGGYLSRDELGWLAEHRKSALSSTALAAEHKQFLRDLEDDGGGLPTYRGFHAGIGGVYDLVPA